MVDIIGTTGGPEADGVTRVTIDPPTGTFDIDLDFVTSVTASQQLAFTDAAAKWSSVITGDIGTALVNFPFIFCGGAVNEYVDDLKIKVIITTIDGPGNILGQAAPCAARAGNNLPAFGFMQFDIDDVATLEGNNQFDDVVLHEMGHVLGIGGLWDDFGLLRDSTGALSGCPDTPNDPYFSGMGADTAFFYNGGSTYAGGYTVPVEGGFGDGTRCVHWRESVLDDELMTGFSEAPGSAMPLSQVTARSLADMGYAVDTLSAGIDSWTCPACSAPAGTSRAGTEDGGFQFVDDVLFLPLYLIDESGNIVGVRR
jgi:hypothetical protein